MITCLEEHGDVVPKADLLWFATTGVFHHVTSLLGVDTSQPEGVKDAAFEVELKLLVPVEPRKEYRFSVGHHAETWGYRSAILL